MKKRGRKLNKKGIIFLLILILIITLLLVLTINNKSTPTKTIVNYISSEVKEVKLYDEELKEVESIVRGKKVDVYNKTLKDNDTTYKKIKYNNNIYYINEYNLTDNESDIIKEKELFVRTSSTIYKEASSSKIESFVKKGEKVDILGFDYLKDDGSVNRYKIKYNDKEGYVYSKYLVSTKEEAIKVYSENNIQEYMEKMCNIGGGDAVNLDYYPFDKPKFKDNVMPDEARTLYINAGAVKDIDSYIDFAINNNINALVIDIKDNTTPAYNSPVMKEYSMTNYNAAFNTFEDYKSYVKKAKDKGLYLIGRITTFKDSYYVMDHNEAAILSSNGKPFNHNGSYWPSAYNRGVWEFNVELAKEAVKEMGFNEIQFDYVRFPDRTGSLEKNGTINFNNIYGEEKAEAIQSFIMYAADEIHSVGAYVSIDVFGESASNYVTAYGQFWPAISNVCDAISGMPYPDHFNAHEYGISEVVWTVPYKLLSAWGKTVSEKQSIIPTPAVVRTWIQTYNTIRAPYIVYDADKISEQIQALYDNGLTGGFITWNSSSSLSKYKEVSYAFKKVYK